MDKLASSSFAHLRNTMRRRCGDADVAARRLRAEPDAAGHGARDGEHTGEAT
jgi:hypothetical protein